MVRHRGSALGRFFGAVDVAGHRATMIGRTAIYGVRHTPATNAGTAPDRTPAIGAMLHSVWEGPRQIRSGAPVLKRDRRG